MSDDYRDGGAGPSWDAPFIDDTPLSEFDHTTTLSAPLPQAPDPAEARQRMRELFRGIKLSEPEQASADESPTALVSSDMYSLSFEEAVLGSVFINAYEVVPELLRFLKPSDFYFAKHRWIWEAQVDVYKSGRVMDFSLVSELLERRGYLQDIGGAAELTRLLNSVATSVNAEAYGLMVRDYATRRMAQAAAQNIVTRAYSRSSTSEQLVAYARQQIAALETREAELATEDTSAGTIFQEAYESKYGANAEPECIPTPFGKHMNRGLAGGWPIGQLSIIAGRQGGGKSSALGAQAQYTTEQKTKNRVIIGSMEMTAKQWILMMAAQKMGVSLDDDNAEDAIARYKAPETLRIFRTPNVMAEQLAARIRREAMQMGGVDLVIVDHWGLVDHAPKKRGLMLTAAIGASNKIIIALADELKCAVIIAVQLSREGRTGDIKPELTHLRESGEYEQDGRRVMFLWRSNDDSTNTAPVVPAELIIAKNNDGPCFVHSLMYNKPKRTFHEVSKAR